MLVLSRQLGQRILIRLPGGRFITVEVCRLSQGCVRLGVVAPGDVPIFREEVWQDVQASGARKARLAVA